MEINATHEPDYEDLFVDLRVGPGTGINNVAVRNVTDLAGEVPFIGLSFSNLHSPVDYQVLPSIISVAIMEPQKVLDKVRKARELNYDVTLRVISGKTIVALLPIHAVALRAGGIDYPAPDSNATMFVRVMDFYVNTASIAKVNNG